MTKVRVSVTLTGEQAEAFEELARQKYGNNHYRRSKLLRLAVEGILGSGGNVTFAGPRSVAMSIAPSLETNGGFMSANPQALEIRNELENGDSEGAKLYRKHRDILTSSTDEVLYSKR